MSKARDLADVGNFDFPALDGTAGEVLTSASSLDSSKLSGALPAIDGSALTGVGGGIGEGQTWQNVSASRSSGVTYTNTSGSTIIVSAGFVLRVYSMDEWLQGIVDGFTVSYERRFNPGNQIYYTASLVVPNNSTYRFNTYGELSQYFWAELR